MGAVILLSDAADSILFAEGIIFLERFPKGIISTHASEEQAGLLVEGIRLLGKMGKMGIVSIKNIPIKPLNSPTHPNRPMLVNTVMLVCSDLIERPASA